MNQVQQRHQKLAITAMLGALALIVSLFIRVPGLFVSFLTYEPKDVILTLGGLLFGPFVGLGASLIACVLELAIKGSTGLIGFFLNLLTSLFFIMPTVFLYRGKRRAQFRNLLLGLFLSVVSLTVVALLWNIILTPVFLNTTLDKVLPMIVPILLPFNLLKGFLNAGLLLLLYRPVSFALNQMGLKSLSLDMPVEGQRAKKERIFSYAIGAFLFLTSCAVIYFLLHR